MTAFDRGGEIAAAGGVTIASGDIDATFLPDLGMLGVSLRRRGEELVALPGGVETYRSGHQTGLPLLAPWANRLAGWGYQAGGANVDLSGLDLPMDGNGLPIHGTMTAAPGWEVVERDADRLRAQFEYNKDDRLLSAFPFPHRWEIEAKVESATIRVRTTLRPTSQRAAPVAFGWHPYLRLPHGTRAAWRLRLPARQHYELDSRGIPTGASVSEAAELESIGDRTFDDLYALGDDRELALEGDGGRLAVRYGDGYPYAQVFAPPAADFVCLEPMTALTNALSTGACPLVEPGGSFTAEFTIVVV